MTQRIPQSTAQLVVFKAYLASDHTTEATSKTVAITISKNGGAFGNPNAGATNATEISSGWYKVTLDTTDTNTTGPLAVRGAVATVDDVGILLEVVSATSGGYTNLDAAVTSRMATYTQPTGFLAATFPATIASTTNITTATGIDVTKWNGGAIPAVNVTGVPLVDLKYTLGTLSPATAGSVRADAVTGAVGSVTGLTASNLDTTVSSRMATYTQPTGFLAATFPGTIASTTNITAGTITTTTNLTTNNDKTGYALSSLGIQAIWDALTSALTTVGSIGKLLVDNINATISSRLATLGYTSPDNTSITNIKTKTDSLTFTVAGQVDSNIQYVNDTQVTGNGSAGTPWGP